MRKYIIPLLLVAVGNAAVISIDTGAFLQKELYESHFSFLYLGFLTAILIEAMIALTASVASRIEKILAKTFLLALCGVILLLSFSLSSSKYAIPMLESITERENNKNVSRLLESERQRGEKVQDWMKNNRQSLNYLLQERYQKEVFNKSLKNLKAQENEFIPLLLMALVVVLKFLMQGTSACFFYLAGNFRQNEGLSESARNFVSNPHEESLSSNEDASEENREYLFENISKQAQEANGADSAANPKQEPSPIDISEFEVKDEPGEADTPSSFENKKNSETVFENENSESEPENLASLEADETVRKSDPINSFDLKSLKKESKLTNRAISKETGLKESEVSIALNKSGILQTFLEKKLRENGVNA